MTGVLLVSMGSLSSPLWDSVQVRILSLYFACALLLTTRDRHFWAGLGQQTGTTLTGMGHSYTFEHAAAHNHTPNSTSPCLTCAFLLRSTHHGLFSHARLCLGLPMPVALACVCGCGRHSLASAPSLPRHLLVGMRAVASHYYTYFVPGPCLPNHTSCILLARFCGLRFPFPHLGLSLQLFAIYLFIQPHLSLHPLPLLAAARMYGQFR